MGMGRRNHFRKEYVDNFNEIQRLYESGVSLGVIYEKLKKEGKVTVSLGHFKNMHSEVPPDMIPKLRDYYKNQVDHYTRFQCVVDNIAELMKEGISAEKVFAILSKAGEITMSLRLFRAYSQKHGLILRVMLGTSSAIEHEFLKKMDKIVRNLKNGKKARVVFDEMLEAGELKMSFSTFRGYCFKHGVDMTPAPCGRKQKKTKTNGSQIGLPEEQGKSLSTSVVGYETKNRCMKMDVKFINSPSGLTPDDNLEDALLRADELASPDGSRYSAVMLTNRDARRIVVLAREYRTLLSMVK